MASMMGRNAHRRRHSAYGRSRCLAAPACIALALAAPACSSDEGVDESVEVLLWDQEINYCGKMRGIDRLGQLYQKQGCEDGTVPLSLVGITDPSEFQTIRTAMLALPPADETRGERCLRHRFFERDGGERTFASVCGSGSGYDDLTGLREPYASVARRFLAPR